MIFLECEVCGASNAGKKADIDGAELLVCESCSSLGENVHEAPEEDRGSEDGTSETSSVQTTPKKRKVLKSNYGDLVQSAREDEEMTMGDLSDKIKEKKSVIKRIENQELKPDDDLLNSLEREFDIEFTEEVDVDEWEEETGKDESLTIGDVAEIE